MQSFTVLDPGICNDDGKQLNDHYAIHWTLSITKPPMETKVIEFRELKKINYERLGEELINSELVLVDSEKTLNED